MQPIVGQVGPCRTDPQITFRLGDEMTYDQVGGCRLDPKVTYNEDMILHVTTSISTTPDEVERVWTAIRMPSGTIINRVQETGGPLASKETLEITCTGKPGEIQILTDADTMDNDVAVTVTASVDDHEPTTTQGISNSTIRTNIKL